MTITEHSWSCYIPEIEEENWNQELAMKIGIDFASEYNEDSWIGRLAEEYQGVPAGTLVAGENTVEGHTFWVIEN